MPRYTVFASGNPSVLSYVLVKEHYLTDRTPMRLPGMRNPG